MNFIVQNKRVFMRQAGSVSLVTVVLLSLFMVVTSAQAVPRSEKLDLTGTWIGKASTFTLDRRGCTAGWAGQLTADGQDANRGVEINVTQRGNQLIIPDQIIAYSGGSSGSYTQHNQGMVSGNRVKLISSANASFGSFVIESIGTIRNDGNTITGEVLCKNSPGSATAKGTFTWTRKASTRKNIYTFRYVRRNFTLAEGVGIHGTYSVDVNARVVGSNLDIYLSIDSASTQIGSLSADGYVQILLDGQLQQRIGLTSKLKNQYVSNPGSSSLILEAEKPVPLPANGRVELEVYVSPVLNTGSGFVPLEISPSPERFPL